MERYTLRLTVQGESPDDTPVKPVDLAATNDGEAIELGKAKIAETVPANYTFIKARVCRGEEVIWQYHLDVPPM
jgi:hypothetical protein